MRSIRGFDLVCDPVNVWGAWQDFRRGKRRRPDVAAFAMESPSRVLALARALRDGQWRPGPYRLLRICDPKRRIVAAAGVPDRVVHHAVHRVVAPVWNRSFIAANFACLEGRGVHKALLTFQRAQRKHRWLLHLDIRRFFYSIDRQRLRSILQRRLPERPLRSLIDRILDSGGGLYRRPAVAEWLGWDTPAPPGRGLPIGNLTSQWWGNVYLDGLDHHVCRTLRVGAYLRYMDDFVLFSNDQERLLDLRDQVGAWLNAERGLTLKDPAAPVLSAHAPKLFLGHRVSRAEIRLGPKAKERLPGRLRAAERDIDRLEAVVQAYAALWRFGAQEHRSSRCR